ncbi:Developmentally-regulated GTP-binding protein 2 [Astathelohania contejeani]|uniref:Developmentally-regulated GTP-binding protein 2 n=1 Tax=Astathelohania contejeani TaxID=164912 RepID=A0ABQ7I0G1_9MICR|nr:Developmentally-regulated GTP-binding protein 2 [Thelohania contejeani]
MGIEEKISDIINEMNRTQKNKKTEHHLGLLKARLAKLRSEQITPKSASTKGKGFEVQKSGDARVALIGFPSVGKSTLLNRLTDTKSQTSEHEFTTLTCIAGNLNYNGATIQMLDLPGIISGAASGKGRGRQVVAAARTADLILMVLDPRRPQDKEILEKELFDMRIRLNKKRPDISLTPTLSGGISITITVKLTHLTESIIHGIVKEYKINNCILVIREDITDEDLIDVISDTAVYINCLYCYNKIDNIGLEDLEKLDSPNNVLISCQKNWNLDELQDAIWEHLEMKRIYTKKKGVFPDLETPVVIRKNDTVKDLCMNIHRDFIDIFKYALVWGRSAKHNPQKVGLNHQLSDEDVVQIYTSNVYY